MTIKNRYTREEIDNKTNSTLRSPIDRSGEYYEYCNIIHQLLSDRDKLITMLRDAKNEIRKSCIAGSYTMNMIDELFEEIG